MHIPAEAEGAIRQSWEAEPPALYGRLDLAYDGAAIKLLEYNADTPTSLLEASVIQWRWLENRFPQADQWNAIHERLVAKWRDLKPYLSRTLYFAHDGADEDALTVAYLADTAREAGLDTATLPMARLGWNAARGCFVDERERAVESLFKLYPWETLLREPFGAHALRSMARGRHPERGRTQWIEPVWKMLWSNKALLAVLWALYSDHPLLLPAFLDGPRGMTAFVRKPLLGREGANVSWTDGARTVETAGAFADGPWVYQALASPAQADGYWAVLGVWMVDGEPCGLGMREGATPVIRNTDRFVPHLFQASAQTGAQADLV